MNWIYLAVHPDGIKVQGMRIVLICGSDLELQKAAAATKAASSGKCSFIDLSDTDITCAEQSPRWKGRRAWATFKVLPVLQYNLEAAFFAAAAVEAGATASTAAVVLIMASFFALGLEPWNLQEASAQDATKFMADICKAVRGPATHLLSRGDVWISLGLHFRAAAITEGFSGECTGLIDIIPGIQLDLSYSKALDGRYRECAKHLGLETLQLNEHSIPTGFTPEEENFIMRMLFGSYIHCAVMRNIVEDHNPASHALPSGSLPTKVVLTDMTSTQTVTMQPFTKCAFPSLMEPDDRGPLIVLGLDLLKYRNAAEARQNTSSSSWEVGRMTEIPDAIVTEWLENLQATGVTKTSIQEVLRSLFVPSLNDWEL